MAWTFELVRGDIRFPESLAPFFDLGGTGIPPERTVVMHTAGIVSIASKYQQNVVDVNVQGTRNIVDACLKAGIGRLVYTSSVHAIPELDKGETIVEIDGSVEEAFSGKDVSGLYARTKAMATRIVLDAIPRGLDVVIVHPSGILGPGDYGNAHLTQMVLDYMQGRLTAYVRGGYDLVDVRDVAMGMILAAERGRTGESYILSNRYVEVGDLMKLLRRISGHRRRADADAHGLCQDDRPAGGDLVQTDETDTVVYALFPVYLEKQLPVQPRQGDGRTRLPSQAARGIRRGHDRLAACAGEDQAVGARRFLTGIPDRFCRILRLIRGGGSFYGAVSPV